MIGSAGGPLAGIRVCDLSRVLAGPWCSQLLADLGAEVIKIERPGEGDDTRGWGPPFLKDRSGSPTSDAAYFLSTNRGKRSVTIDIAHPEGQRLVRRLAASSDVLLENFKVGGLAKYGLDYASLRDEAPGIVYCSITGFGQTGPYAHRAGYDFLVQGMGGLMSVTGEPDEVPGGGPMKVGVAITDLFTGMYAAVAILAALAHRARTGEGQYIDLALMDVQVATLANQAMNYLASGQAPGRLGNAHPNIVPYQAFRASDGHIILAVGNDAQFRRFCEVAGRADLAEDDRYRSNAGRVANRSTLVPLLADLISARPRREWLDALEREGVPCGPINRVDEVFTDPQVMARTMVVGVDHPLAGVIPLVANPIRFSATPIAYESAPPVLGADTGAVLREVLDLDDRAINELRSAGVV